MTLTNFSSFVTSTLVGVRHGQISSLTRLQSLMLNLQIAFPQFAWRQTVSIKIVTLVTRLNQALSVDFYQHIDRESDRSNVR